MNTKFRVLYRQFLFRLMDVELLATSARGDSNELLGRLGALLIFGSLLVAYAGIGVCAEARDTRMPGPLWGAERFMISATMLVVGVFALLSWDSTFPDRRDVLVLAPLPVRGRTLFAAKIAAAASALGLTVAAWNCLSGFVWPMALAPAGTGFIGTIRFVAVFWLTLIASGTFVYCFVLGVQAVAAQLPRSWYLRVSSVLHIALFALFLGLAIFQPSFSSAAALAAPENQGTLDWVPTYWFVGLLSELSGLFRAESHPVMAPLARRAVASLAFAIVLAGAAFLLSYLRTLRKIVEEPDIAPGSRGGIWLPRFGNSPETALVQFIIRTELRSRPHRTMLAFYLGGGFAISSLFLVGAKEMLHLTWLDVVGRLRPPMLFASVVMLCASVLGTRTAFSLPLDLRANWLFRVIPMPGPLACLSAARRALLALAVFPVLAGWTLLLCFWPWTPAAQHFLLLGLAGSILADVALMDFRKIPFTCSYLPGKSKAHLVFWFGILPLMVGIQQVATQEERAMASPWTYWSVAAALVALAITARMLSNTSAKQGDPEIQFEEHFSDELIGLGLSR